MGAQDRRLQVRKERPAEAPRGDADPWRLLAAPRVPPGADRRRLRPGLSKLPVNGHRVDVLDFRDVEGRGSMTTTSTAVVKPESTVIASGVAFQ